MIDLDEEEKHISELRTKLSTLKDVVRREEEEVVKADARIAHTQDAQEILQRLAEAVQQQAHKRISEVVSSCLSAVFDDPYEFKIQFERKRGRTEAHLVFTRRTLQVDPLTASGGGVVDVAAFALRIACLVLHRPRLQHIVVLDEPFHFVSEQYQGNVREMLEQLSKDMKIQIVMITHNENYATGKIIEL